MSKTSTDKDEGVNKHFIPSHFFDTGDYEVWTLRHYQHTSTMQCIASGLSLATAKRFNWVHAEIRQNGKPLTPKAL